ncbi:MAG TPA: Hint domain-containing protein, partial [Rhodanobacteraceae bacterium]
STIVQAERVETVEYFHIELDKHDVIVAEGALSESFLDDDSRGMFHNAHEFHALYPQAAGKGRYCAPRLDIGYEVEAVRQAIAQRAGLLLCAASPGAVRGAIDAIGADAIEGWAQNDNEPDAPVCLDIFIGGRCAGQALANRYREDLAAAGIGRGHHAFRFELPSGLMVGNAAVDVRRSLDGERLG